VPPNSDLRRKTAVTEARHAAGLDEAKGRDKEATDGQKERERVQS